MTIEDTYRQYAIEEYTVDREPFYVPVKDEIELFEAAYTQKIPVLLKGPTGCGKTRFIEHMAYKLGRPLSVIKEVEPGSENGHGRPKDLKHTRPQRFRAVESGYPPRALETRIIGHEGGFSDSVANDLAKLGEKVRPLKEHGLAEGVSTRLLIYAGRLIHEDIPARRACQVAVVWALTDDRDVQRSIEEGVSSIFE